MIEKILIVGDGGREHALGNKLHEEGHRLVFAPGNAGTAQIGENVPVKATDILAVRHIARRGDIGLTVVGPEKPLELGIVDAFGEFSLPIFGPTQSAARLETSKIYSAEIMERYGIPSPQARAFSSVEEAKTYVIQQGAQNIVIKDDAPAGGKGVFLPRTTDEAVGGIIGAMSAERYGTIKKPILIQERLSGPELSVLAICDGHNYVLLPNCRDHKQRGDGGTGDMTGGMGAFGPVKDAEPYMGVIQTEIIERVIEAMAKEGNPFSGVLYAGMILTEDGPKVIEFNARFGDPEAQAQSLLLGEDLYPYLRAGAAGSLEAGTIKTLSGFALSVALVNKDYPADPGQGKIRIFGLEQVPPDVKVFHAKTRHRNQRTFTGSGRTLHVAARGETLQEARDRAYSAIGDRAINFAGMDYRRDIGELDTQA